MPGSHCTWRAAATALLFVLGLAVRGNSAFDADGKVHELTGGNFDEAVKRHELTFVEFYAPWCGHCKKLAPEWDRVASLSRSAGVPVAKVDATAHKKLAEKQGVESFPTLKLFQGSPEVSKVYSGPRTADKMAEWATLWRGAPLLERPPDASAEALLAWARERRLSILGLLTGDSAADAATRRALEAMAFALNLRSPGSEVRVGETDGPGASVGSLLRELGAVAAATAGPPTPPCALLFRDFELEEKVFAFPQSGGGDWLDVYSEMMAFFKLKQVPALITASEDTQRFFLHDIDPGNGIVAYFGESDGFRRDMHELAVRFSGSERRLKWVHAKADDFGQSFAKSVSLHADEFPEVVIWEFGETEDSDKVYRLSQGPAGGGEITKESVEDFVKSWQGGQLSAEKDPVLAVTSASFDQDVLKSEKDVLVEFFAPWCGHCKALAPEYRQVAAHYASDKGVAIAKMDATAHKHKFVTITSYPTLKLFPRNQKDAPIDLEFKAGRDKDSIVDFVEKHRTTTKKGKGRATVEARATGPATAGAISGGKPAVAPQPPAAAAAADMDVDVSCPAGGASVGVWVFDDAAEPRRRGEQLTADMVGSRGGYTLVQVGDVGLLIPPGSDSVARAVRRFASLEVARTHVASLADAGAAGVAPAAGAAPAASAPTPGALPCPANADRHSCDAWCEGVMAIPPQQVSGSLSGKPCAGKQPKDTADPPRCLCRGAAGKDQPVLAMCVSPCAEGVAPHGLPPERAPSSPAEGAHATAAAATTSPSERLGSHGRFLLYDTKYGEGFNLQREVYPRAGWVVAQLNKALDQSCGASTLGGCARWTLILPPWCKVVHWWSGPAHVPWSAFFDMAALKGSDVPVLEFEEYVRLTGGAAVDVAISYQTEPLEAAAQAKIKGGRGKFSGWAGDFKHCARSAPPHQDWGIQLSDAGGVSLTYAGQCEGGIRAKETRCAVLDGPWPQGVADMVGTLGSDVSSVLVKGYDYLLSPDNDELDALGLRESMLLSPEIRKTGDDFIASALRGKAYLAAHCRRTDFLRARTKTTPSAEVIATKLNKALEETSMNQVFVATDAPEELREELRQQVKGTVHFFEAPAMGAALDHPGKQAAVEIWVAARANFFVGTQESRFTMAIQLERGFLGKPRATSEQEFCKDAGKQCTCPKYRHPNRRGAHREAYIK